jgi:enoyl-[acyl-carrier protein] reductase I
MVPIDLSGTNGLVFGVANHRSIAWAIAKLLSEAGARLAFTYQGDRLRENVEKLAGPLPGSLLLDCDVTDDAAIARVFETVRKEFGALSSVVHSVAFAKKEDLEADFLDTSRDGFALAHSISAYSLIPIAKHAAALMEGTGGSIVTLTYIAAERVIPRYNVMGSAKASLEFLVRQLAFELGPRNVRVNAISAGPLNTLAARGVSHFTDIFATYRERAPLKRNVTQEEVARSGLYLLSDLSSGVTGEVLHVDAGFHIMGI